MVENDQTLVPEPEDREDYTRLRENAPEILEASRRNPPKDDTRQVEKKEDSETGPGGSGW